MHPCPVVVGAGDLECRIAPFSSRGKSQNPNRKGPDVYYHPGVAIEAARARGTRMGTPRLMTIIRPPAAPVWRPPHAAGYLTVLLDYVRRIRNPSDDEEGSREQALKALASGGDDVSPCPYKETCGPLPGRSLF